MKTENIKAIAMSIILVIMAIMLGVTIKLAYENHKVLEKTIAFQEVLETRGSEAYEVINAIDAEFAETGHGGVGEFEFWTTNFDTVLRVYATSEDGVIITDRPAHK